MKQFKIFSLLLALVGMVFVTSCVKDDDPVGMDPSEVNVSYLYGKWQNDNKTSEYKRYTTNAVTPPVEGSYNKEVFMWDLAQDVQEGDDGTKSYYYVDGNQIKEARPNMGSYVYRIYTLTKLTNSKLEYFYGSTTYSYTKVN